MTSTPPRYSGSEEDLEISAAKEEIARGSASDDVESGDNLRYKKRASGEASEGWSTQTDAVFGKITEEGPNYKALGWLSTSVLMIKAQLGLGVLSLPFVLSTLGMVPGILCIIAVGIIMSWGEWMIGEFKLSHPEVYTIDDVGQIIFGRIGRETFALASLLFMIFAAGAGMLSMSVALNALSTHGACTAIFVAVSAIAAGLIGSIQTLGRIQALGWIGVVSILSAVIVLTITVGIQERPNDAPTVGPWDRDVIYFGSPTFAQASSAVSSIVVSYAGAPSFFNMIAEMKQPRHYNRSLALCQIVITATYLIIGCVVYHYAGQYVSAPALGSAGPLLKKVCYGLALPGLLVSAILWTHFPAKFIFVRVLRNTEHLSKNTVKHWVVWIGSVLGCCLSSYIVASAIPEFGGLVSLIGASVGTLVCIQPMGVMWLYDNWNREKRDWKWKFMVGWSVFIVVIGFFLMGAGTYGSVMDIIAAYAASNGSAAWSCADNSNSV
ncbi:putative amino acid transporter [Papiliotrema laurentii]|uniref:Amino acid transporter n=1 Tax=Papiliotrema laurentii TaxID=5418 RepID=A0AAD9CUI8_PAPLA|nr:putative amino acid transporter [Papiliotrema laurentii]